MKVFLLSVLLAVFFRTELLGCCISHMVTVFPVKPDISSNSIFLINFAENDFKFKENAIIKNFHFQATGNKGQIYPLKQIAINFAGTSGQILLQSDKPFQLNDSIAIAATYTGNMKADTSEINNFIKQLSWKKWKVVRKADVIKPVLNTGEIKKTVIDNRNLSASGYGMLFKIGVTDNSIQEITGNLQGDEDLFVYYEVIFNDQKYIVPSYQSAFSIYMGMCGNNFKFKLGQQYAASVRAMDTSGNFSNERKFTFTVHLTENTK